MILTKIPVSIFLEIESMVCPVGGGLHVAEDGVKRSDTKAHHGGPGKLQSCKPQDLKRFSRAHNPNGDVLAAWRIVAKLTIVAM